MKARVKNPFLVSGYISPEYFCDRDEESKRLVSYIENGRNVALISLRRMGKTGLIDHCFYSDKIQKEYYTFFIDIYSTGSLKEFVYFLGKEIFEKLKGGGQKFFDKFFSVITSLRPAFKLDPIHGNPVFDIGIGEITEPEVSMEQIFDYLERADKPCIVAIDEFQQIAKYPEGNVEAILRTHIQRCHNANFIFAGSEQHMMHDIFLKSSRPFYQSVAFVELEPIPLKEYTDFVLRHFEKSGKSISEKLVKGIYRMFEGHTWYMQCVFNSIYAFTESGEHAGNESAILSINDTIGAYQNIYKVMMGGLSDRQKELLVAIAKDGKAFEITSAPFIKRHGLNSSSSVQSAARNLVAKEVVHKKDGYYVIDDRFFRIWVVNEYGPGYVYQLD